MQVIESINYLLDCHAGVAGSSPVRSSPYGIVRPDHMGNTVALKGLGAHSKSGLFWSKNPRS
jgi:hypothetical protein